MKEGIIKSISTVETQSSVIDGRWSMVDDGEERGAIGLFVFCYDEEDQHRTSLCCWYGSIVYTVLVYRVITNN